MFGDGKTSALEVADSELVYRQFSLRVVSGPDEGKEALSAGEEATVGTESGNDLVLSDRTVSRHHLAVRATARGLELVDLDSTNGTVLGGYRVGSAVLEPGALVGAGRTVIRVDFTGLDIREPLSERDRFGGAIGVSTAMRRVFALLERFAPSGSTVLLEGETGTGKEVLAEAIHQQSLVHQGPFVVVDCAAIPPTLIESELFGHLRGAFTGAISNRPGAFETASGGTLFLDEVGELPLPLQAVLLRALEDRTVKRVGDDRRVPVDVRVIAATNRDLREEVNHRRFRADLFYRLAILRVRVPPLRDRRQDVPALIRHFWDALAADLPQPARPILREDLVTALSAQRWPGNVRQLRSAVQRAIHTGDAALAFRELLGAHAGEDDDAFDLRVTYGQARDRAVGRWEAEYVHRLLAAFDGNLSRAARSVGMSRNHLRTLALRRGGR